MPTDSWVVRARIQPGTTLARRYFKCFVHALQQMLMVSPGIVPSERVSEDVMSACSIFLGFVCAVRITAAATTQAQETSKAGATRAFYERMSLLESWMRHSKLEPGLRSKLRIYFELYYTQRQCHDEKQILGELSRPLRHEVLLKRSEPLLRRMKIQVGSWSRANAVAAQITNAIVREVRMPWARLRPQPTASLLTASPHELLQMSTRAASHELLRMGSLSRIPHHRPPFFDTGVHAPGLHHQRGAAL